MFTFEEIKNLIESFSTDSVSIDQEMKSNITRVASQLSYSVPNCTCKDKFADLVIKLKIWLKIHKDGFCHYEMAAGMVRKGPDGNNVYQLNLTDETAKWILENDPEGAKYIKQVLPFDEVKSTEEAAIIAEAVETPKKTKKYNKKKTKDE